MKSTRSPYFCLSCSAMSVTGPHTRDLQSWGVANSSATGFFPTTSENDVWCSSGAGGRRVSIASSSPRAEATVSVSVSGAGSPTSGILSWADVRTSIWVGAATRPPPDWVVTSTDHGPFFGSGTSAAYTAAKRSVSDAAWRERNGGSVTSTSAGAGYGPRALASGLGATYTAVLPYTNAPWASITPKASRLRPVVNRWLARPTSGPPVIESATSCRERPSTAGKSAAAGAAAVSTFARRPPHPASAHAARSAMMTGTTRRIPA